MRVLIIDDDKIVCSSLKIILASDQEVEVVGIGHSGLEGIKLYEDLTPDILLMDISLQIKSQ